MAQYGQAFNNKVLPPNRASQEDASLEVGVSVFTLERWRAESWIKPARERAWSAEARLNAVFTRAAKGEAGCSVWCRVYGFYPQEFEAWRTGATQTLDTTELQSASPKETAAYRKRIKEHERELRRKHTALTNEECRLLKRRQAIESCIGHLKADRRMDRCHLKGSEGDALHAVLLLCAAGYNIRWLLRMIAKNGLSLLMCLLQASGLTGLYMKLAEIIGLNRLQSSSQCWALA